MKLIAMIFSRFMALIVLAVAALALFVPASCAWVPLKSVNYFLMVAMFGMGLTMKLNDFKVVFVHPKEMIVGCVAQFTIMPLLAFALGKIFGLEAALLAGVILVGTCPGGTSSNVITYMGKGNVALSVGMTSVNTLLSPVLTPAITYLLLHTSVNVDVWAMCLSILQVVILPIALGFVVNRFAAKFVARAVELLPVISVIAICLIVSTVVSHNAGKIMTTGAIVFVVVILHNLLGYACGFGVGKLFRMDLAKTKALTVEIGMQNSGLATSLAASAFPSLAMATVPGAIFSVWHNISGAVLAGFLQRKK
ncbi:bile acid:sodium symporter family protein [Fibrobacter sp.]|uniref:bile acid:sodium symporter family protein n=1 Tax=Fibrobacter sp. TaxID=35828 RepID=UPI00388D4A9B